MASTALRHWEGNRSDRLDELVKARREVGGAGQAKLWRIEQLDWSLFLRLAGEFQGFCRELHELGAERFAELATSDASVRSVLAKALTSNRQLDRGNANKGALGSDFGIFGIQWWPALEKRNKRTTELADQLDRLDEVRNAVAHDDRGKIAALNAEGHRISLRTFGLWRQSLGGLATTMDAALSDHLAALL